MGQALLFPDPRPLDERLGRKFFLKAPRRAGVYLMKDGGGRVLYVGKAVDLKRRLNNYRVANPDRMPRRHLRMLRQVAGIEFQFCAGESAALRRESKLLRSLKPRFNRAGVWPGKPRFLIWRPVGDALQLGVAEVPESGWRRFGPLNAGAVQLCQSLSRLLWLALNPGGSVTDLPAGWWQGKLPHPAAIFCAGQAGDVLRRVEGFFWDASADLAAWFGAQFSGRGHPFEKAVIGADLEQLQAFQKKRPAGVNQPASQLILL